MSHIASNMIAQARSQFSDQSTYVLTSAHGHHFAVHRPPRRPPQPRPRATSPPPRKRTARPAEMVDASVADPEQLLAQKQQKIAAHNARITALNNSKAKAEEADPGAEAEEEAAPTK